MPTWASAPMPSSAAPRGGAPARARRTPPHGPDQLGVRAPAERSVQVDHGHLTGHGELLEPRQRVATVEHEVAPVAELDGAAVDEVDAGNDHRRVRIPRSARSALMPATVSSPSWKTDAASTASAPARNASATWARVPMPPEPMTGTVTAPPTARPTPWSGATSLPPPPTVTGIGIGARTRATVSTSVSWASGEAATSSTTSSSAPCAS